MNYLIIDDECVAQTNEDLKSGEKVRVAWLKTDSGLCNAQYAKVSKAKKWDNDLNAQMSDYAILHSDIGLYKDFYAGQ